MTLRNILLTLAAAIGLGLTWRVFIAGPDDPEPRAELPAESGYYMRDAIIEGAGNDGRRLYTLRAERIVHHPEDDSVALEEVDLAYGPDPDTPWRLAAKTGRIPADGNLIHLAGNVTVSQTAPTEGPQATLSTPSLSIDIESQIARTPDPVHMTQGNYLLTGIGMEANLKEDRVRLQSDVHGRFLP